MIWLLAGIAFAGPCEEAQALRAGDPVFCDGVLMPAATSLSLIQCKAVELPTCQADLGLCEANNKITIDQMILELEAERKHILELSILLDDNPVASPPRWYEHPGFWGSVGVAVGVSVGAAVVSR